jgi:hypothetical protein
VGNGEVEEQAVVDDDEKVETSGNKGEGNEVRGQ